MRCARSEVCAPQGFAGERSGIPEPTRIRYAVAEIRRLAVTQWPPSLPLVCRWTACSRGGGGNVGSGQVFWVAGETRPERFPSSRCSHRSSEWCRASLQTRLFTEKQQARCLVLRGQGEEPWLFSGTVPQAGVGAEGRNGCRCLPSTGRRWQTGPEPRRTGPWHPSATRGAGPPPGPCWRLARPGRGRRPRPPRRRSRRPAPGTASG